MDWIKKFYSTTGKWWGPAESKIDDRDHERVATIKRLSKPSVKSILELGSGYGNTAAACAQEGFNVTAIEISDRVDFAKQYTSQKYKGSLHVIKEDFYKVSFKDKFDVICYWNGFGVGTDDDQRKLLLRMADEWLNKDGCILMDVQNPFVWASWVGEEEHKTACPEEGYNYSISEKFGFDQVNNRFTDTWWETDKPEEKITQDLRCYSPVDILLLIGGTGLKLERIEVEGKEIKINKLNTIDNPLSKASEYLTKLVLK